MAVRVTPSILAMFLSAKALVAQELPHTPQDSSDKKGEEPITYLHLATGISDFSVQDMALSPYRYQGSGGLLQLGYERHKGKYLHLVNVNLATGTLATEVAGMNTLSQEFLELRYLVARNLYTLNRTRFYAGAGLSARVFMRQSPEDLTGEAMASVVAGVGSSTRLTDWYRLDASLRLPVITGILYRGYGLGEEEFQMTGWGGLQAYDVAITNYFHLGGRWTLTAGYTLTYFNYALGDQVRTVLQEYAVGVALSLGKDPTNR